MEDRMDQPALRYYGREEYYESLGNAKSTAHNSHSVRAYSALDQLLFDRVPMTGLYSDQQRNEHHDELVALLLDLASRST